MRTLVPLVAVIASFAVGAAAQDICSPQQSTNRQKLSFAQAVRDVVHVRVYDDKGKQLAEYDLMPAAEQDPEREPFYPGNRYIATTASAGCVRGEARRPHLSPCVAWFELPPAHGPSLERIVVDAPDGTSLNATLKQAANARNVECTWEYKALLPKDEIRHVIHGEQVALFVRHPLGNEQWLEFHYDVDMRALTSRGEHHPAANTLVDPLKRANKKGARGGEGPSLTQLLVEAKRIAAKVRVSK